MPIFVNEEPDIPNHLLHAQEEGLVVFFCGSGISVPAGSPMFKGLVEKLYEKMGGTQNEVEENACKHGQ